MNVAELVAQYEIEHEAARKRRQNASAEWKAILDRVKAEGRKNLTGEESVRCDQLEETVVREKAAETSAMGKLARARALLADEERDEAAMRTVTPTPAARRTQGEDYETSATPRITATERSVELDSSANRAGETPMFKRVNDELPATVTRGQRFTDHEVVKREAAKYAERDRIITGQHGDFGQYLRAMTTTGAAAIVPTVWAGNIIDKARNAAVVMQAGASLVPMDAKVLQIGRLTGDPAPAFKAEGSPVTAGDVSYDYLQLTATSLTALVVTSLEFLQDAPNASESIQNALGVAMGLEIDKAALFGQLGAMGTNDEGSAFALAAPYPKGLLKALVDYNSGSQIVGSFPANGTAQTAATPWAELLGVVYKPLRSNERCTALVSNVALEQQYETMMDSTYQPLRRPEVIAGMPWLKTNAIPSFTRGTMTNRATDVFAGDWSQLLIGQRLGLEIRVLTERYAENGQVGLLAYWRGDVAVARCTAFAAYRGLQGAL